MRLLKELPRAVLVQKLFVEKAGLHPGKTEVRIFDYVDRGVPMLPRMFERPLSGYRAIGYARGEAPLGYAEPTDELVVEHDEDVLRSLKELDDFA